MTTQAADEEKVSVKEEEVTETKNGCKTILRKTIRFVFSTAGLFLVNFGYLLLGAVMFTNLEKYNEQQTCFTGAENYARVENATTTLMVDVASRIANGALQRKGGAEAIRNDYQRVLESFSLSVLDVGYPVDKNCSMLGEKDGPKYDWSFSGSLVFAMTVTTTIGYGVIAPKTPWGRLVCIAYALFGIPIMIICLANVGDVMADIFRFAYATVCCCGCCRKKPKKNKADGMELTPVTTWRTDSSGRPILVDDDSDSDDDDDDDDDDEDEGEITVPLTISLLVLFSFLFLGAALFFVWESWSFADAFYFCFTTFSTIGFGDIVPGTTSLNSSEAQAQLVFTGIYQIIGMAMVSMCFQLMQDEIIAKVRWILAKIGIGKKNDKDKNDDVTPELEKEEPSARPKTAIRGK